MLPLVLGGIAIAATGYKLKKYFENDDNYEKFHDLLIEGYEYIDQADQRVNHWFDSITDPKQETTKRSYVFVDLSDKSYLQKDTYNALNPLFELKSRIYKTLFRETEGLKRSIKNLRQNEPIPILDDLSGIENLEDSSENQICIQEFCEILIKAECIQYRLLDELEKPLSEVDDFERLNDEDKKKALRLMELDGVMHEACQVAITYDGVFVSRIAKRTFGRIKSLLV
jgi:hypothetical protein